MTENPDPPVLHERFLRSLAAHPRRTALQVGPDVLSYEELHELALSWAGALLSGPEQPAAVGVLTTKDVVSYAGILAALYAGATAVPLHAGFPPSRTRRMLRDAGVSAVIADRSGLAALQETGLDLPVLAPASGDAELSGHRAIRVRPGEALTAPRTDGGRGTAYLLFTSGSTGRPKGVPISHASLDSYFRHADRRYDFAPDDVFSQATEVNFDCHMFDLFCAWGAGASVHAVPARAYLDLPAFVAERRMTVWFSTPSGIAVTRRRGGLAPGSLSSLRWSFFAGEALLCKDTADWQAAAPGSVVENLYGPTELTITVTGHRWEPERSGRLSVNGIVPIGTVHPGHAHLLLTEAGELSDSEGELCITGPQMTAGYLEPSDGEGRFLHHDERIWYRTGDRVRRLENGELAYLGRLDAQVQVQGWRVELAEVDAAVRACTGVVDAVTVTRPAPEGGLELVVFYTGAPLPPARLARELGQSLPSGLLPRRYEHVEAFPLNSNRKVDRRELTARAAA